MAKAFKGCSRAQHEPPPWGGSEGGEGWCRGMYPDGYFMGSPALSGELRLPHHVEAQAGDWLGDSKSAQSQIKWLDRNWIQLVQPCGF